MRSLPTTYSSRNGRIRTYDFSLPRRAGYHCPTLRREPFREIAQLFCCYAARAYASGFATPVRVLVGQTRELFTVARPTIAQLPVGRKPQAVFVGVLSWFDHRVARAALRRHLQILVFELAPVLISPVVQVATTEGANLRAASARLPQRPSPASLRMASRKTPASMLPSLYAS